MITALILGTIATVVTITSLVENENKKAFAKKYAKEQIRLDNENIRLEQKGKMARIFSLIGVDVYKNRINTAVLIDNANSTELENKSNSSFYKNCTDDYFLTGSLSPICNSLDIQEIEILKEQMDKEELEQYNKKMKLYIIAGVFSILVIVLVLYKNEFKKLIR